MPTLKLKLPAHISLSIEHNDHACAYWTVQDWIDQRGLAEEDWTSPEEYAASLSTGEVWCCQWYPTTPVGFLILCASTLEELLAALSEVP